VLLLLLLLLTNSSNVHCCLSMDTITILRAIRELRDAFACDDQTT
jgi:hypothetical protein